MSIFPRRRGFTLIEMMVVLAIVLTLAGLLLPAIQRSRDRARIAQCRNNVTQIGLALQNYLLAHQVLPPGCVNSIGPIQSVEDVNQYHMSWIAQVLPFLEQANTFHHIDFNQSVYAPVNQPVRQLSINTLICAASHARSFSVTVTTSDYSGVHNDFETPIDANQNGVLFLNSSIALEDVTDGGSSTAFVVESTPIVTTDLGWMSGTQATLRNGVLRTGETSTAPQYNRHYTTNASTPEIATPVPNVVGGPRSYHDTGFHVGFGDGSVRFVSFRVAPDILRNLCHRADGEMLGEF